MKRWWQCIALVMVVATPGVAEDLSVGARLRVTRTNGKSITGTLAALDNRNLTLEQRDASGKPKQAVVSREDVQAIQISRAPSRKGRGALIGFVSGGVSGAVLGYAIACSFANPDQGCLERRRAGSAESFVASIGLVFGALGAGIGAAAAPAEKWETVGLAQVGVSVIPVSRGAAIAVAVRF